jgi:nucleoside-diphosphate-sugar epimerase
LQQVIKTFSYYTPNAQNLFNQIEWVDGDILDYFSLEKILDGVTDIYHCAAIVSFDPKERKRMISNNVEGTANLVNAALEKNVKRICHVSSIAALGRLENGQAVTEETNWIPTKKISGYSESKFFSEVEIWRGIQEGLNAVIVNPSIIFGPSDWETGSSKMFKTIWEGMKFYTKGVTGFVDVKDVVNAMLLLMSDTNFDSAKNQRYIISAEDWCYWDVFNEIAKILEKPKPSIFASDLLLKIVWRVAKAASLLNGKTALITRESVANSNKLFHFDGSKIVHQFGFKYLPISESIKQNATFLKHDMQGS